MGRVKTDQEKNPDKYFNSPQGHIRDRIIISDSAEIPREGIFISLNGFAFLAKPGVEIDLPRPVRLMLDTRIKTEVVQVDGKDHVRHIKRFAYQIVALDVDSLEKEAEVEPAQLEEAVQ